MPKSEVKRITKEQDVTDSGEQIFRPRENFSKPVKPHWKWIWLIIIILVIVAWIFLFFYFNNHHAPYSAPLN